MKLLFEENEAIDYEQYQFPYCVYAVKEEGDSYNQLYKNGFLPYTNNLKEENEIYYLARSVKIALSEHHLKSKQKNILNKLSEIYDDQNLQFELIDKSKLIDDPSFIEWSLRNAKNGFLSAERLSYILKRPYLQQIIRIRYQEDCLAYLYIVHENKDFIHVWYSFYDLRIDHNDFGKWIFLKTIKWAKAQDYSSLFLGTCYAKGAIYKLSLSPATSFFNGQIWDQNTSALKRKLVKENK